MNTPSALTSRPVGADERRGDGVGDEATQLHARLAALAEAGEEAPWALLECVRALVQARAVALIPAGGEAQDVCIVTTQGLPASAVMTAALIGGQPISRSGQGRKGLHRT